MGAPPGWPYSPDGSFWWDGAAWQPVQPPPGPAAQQGPGVPPPPGPPAQQSPGVAPAGRRGGTAVFVLVTVGTLIAALALGGVTGAVVGLTTTEPVTDAAAPDFPERFPAGRQRYLPKATVTMVTVDWLREAGSWRCAKTAAPDPLTGAKTGMICRPGAAAARPMSVFIWYDAPDRLVSVKADCKLGPGTKTCANLFAKMAGALLSPDPDLRAKAEAWAGDNADRAAVTAIGGIRLQTSTRPHSMEAVPAI